MDFPPPPPTHTHIASCIAATGKFADSVTVNSPEHFPVARSVRYSRRAGFTLIEMLVVIAIIGILAQMLFPALLKARNSAVGIACLNQQKQLGQYILQYAFENRDVLPQQWRNRGPNDATGGTVGTGKIPLMEILHRTMFPELILRTATDGAYDGTYAVKHNVDKTSPCPPSLVTCPATVGGTFYKSDQGMDVLRTIAFSPTVGCNSYAPPGSWPSSNVNATTPAALGAGNDYHRLRQIRNPSKIYMLLEGNGMVVEPHKAAVGSDTIGIRYLHNDMTNILYGDGHTGKHGPFIINRGTGKGKDSAGRQLFSNDGRWFYYGKNFDE